MCGCARTFNDPECTHDSEFPQTLTAGLGRGWLIAVPVMLCVLSLLGLVALKPHVFQPSANAAPTTHEPLVFFVVGGVHKCRVDGAACIG